MGKKSGNSNTCSWYLGNIKRSSDTEGVSLHVVLNDIMTRMHSECITSELLHIAGCSRLEVIGSHAILQPCAECRLIFIVAASAKSGQSTLKPDLVAKVLDALAAFLCVR